MFSRCVSHNWAWVVGCLLLLSSPAIAAQGDLDPAAQGSMAGQIKERAKSIPEMKAERFGEWFYRCVEVKTSKQKSAQQCEVVQVSQIKQNEKMVNVLTLAFALAPKDNKEKAKWVLTALTPLNVYLPVGFGLAVDKNKPSTISRYRNCNQAGCWVQQLVNDKLMSRLKKGKNGIGRLRLMNGQNVNIKFSLNGLTAALKALASGTPPKAQKKAGK